MMRYTIVDTELDIQIARFATPAEVKTFLQRYGRACDGNVAALGVVSSAD